MSKPTAFVKKADIDAAIAVMEKRLAVLKKNSEQVEWPTVCADLRAIENECINASRIAAALSFQHEKERWATK